MRQSFYVGIKTIIDTPKGVLILKDMPRNKWELPGGRIDGEESMEIAVGREISEEIPGARLVNLGEVVHLAIGDFLVENNHRLLLAFHQSEVVLPEAIKLSAEHSEYAFVNQSNLEQFELFSTDRAAIEKYLKVTKHG